MLNTSPRRAAAPAPCPVGDLGPNSRLIEEPEIRPAAFLEKFYRDRVFYLEGIEAAAQEKLQLIEENVPRCPNLACKAVVAAEFSRERITSAIGELGEVDNDQREARKFCGDGLRIILRFKKKPERLRALLRLFERLPLSQSEDNFAGCRQILALRQQAPIVLNKCAVLEERHG